MQLTMATLVLNRFHTRIGRHTDLQLHRWEGVQTIGVRRRHSTWCTVVVSQSELDCMIGVVNRMLLDDEVGECVREEVGAVRSDSRCADGYTWRIVTDAWVMGMTAPGSGPT